MNLPNDVSRCHGITAGGTDCQQRRQCERWLQRSTAGMRTPWIGPPVVDAKRPCEHQITPTTP